MKKHQPNPEAPEKENRRQSDEPIAGGCLQCLPIPDYLP
jgi:hypothetical protein